MQLSDRLADEVAAWRAKSYPHADFPAIAEILEWLSGQTTGQPPFLRIPQVRALETYWYLRLVENTPGIFDLYQKLSSSKVELRKALGLTGDAVRDYIEEHGFDALIDHIRHDDTFVKKHKLESLRETLTLAYPSYILALAMGAGKTVLIGAIITTEFAMAQEYPDGTFTHNALVFAPGLTIVESLRELASMPFDGILPPRMYKPFAASVKLTFTRDGSSDIDVIPGSHYNIVVTNTEKIRIRSETIRKGDLGSLFAGAGDAERLKQDVANRRLQRLAQLPHLGVFSDEAHHTYGQSMDTELKKVRKTVDYLAAETNVVCVINTTGTPYYNKQPLLDVVYWYGLSQGIEDGYLKPVSGNIESYDFDDDVKQYVTHVVGDFLQQYGNVTLPNGAKAKLAIYFPQTDDRKAMQPVVEAALAANGHTPAECLDNDTASPKANEDAFKRLNDPDSPHRVILLVDRGTEGWNCPSLFACALARNLKSSNNFVLQAATRCLRQIPGNPHKAKIYLSSDNYAVLDRQLQETYGESLADFDRERDNLKHASIVLRKENIPPVIVKRKIVRVRRVETAVPHVLKLTRPAAAANALTMQRYELAAQASTTRVMRELGDVVELDAPADAADTYTVATDLAVRYRLSTWLVLDALRCVYAGEDVPLTDIGGLAGQIEAQVSRYETESEEVEVALALVRPEGFNEEQDQDGNPIRTAEITYRKDREHLLWKVEEAHADYNAGYGFHYSPYNFDSMPEKNFLGKVLAALQLDPGDIEDVYFTGGFGRDKTDFIVEYKGEDEDYVESYYRYVDEGGRRFMSGDLTGAGPGPQRVFGDHGTLEPPPGRHWMYDQDGIDRVMREDRVYWTRNGVPRLKIYLDEQDGMAAGDIWADIQPIRSWHVEAIGYPTQKPEGLLARIVSASSNVGDLVLDAFIGSGTTAAVAQKLGRCWIGCDINKGAIQTTAKRLQSIMEAQIAEGRKPAQGKLLTASDAPPPAQVGFTHWRVNDYDLAIQHNEAVALACEYLGVERLRTDSFFDGVLGKQLVKIIPFGHPLSPADLEAIRSELDARPEEDRAITVVCLGKELAADKWLEDWNRLRKKKTDPHHIEVIELRSDPKYGGFLQHEPAQARVVMKRSKGKLHVEIKDFISPGIIARLAQQSGVVQPRIADWRSMVDSVMIDPAYDGVVFNVALADVPEKKSDFVQGNYELSAPEGNTTVAVKITDMLGEEVLVTAEIS